MNEPENVLISPPAGTFPGIMAKGAGPGDEDESSPDGTGEEDGSSGDEDDGSTGSGDGDDA